MSARARRGQLRIKLRYQACRLCRREGHNCRNKIHRQQAQLELALTPDLGDALDDGDR